MVYRIHLSDPANQQLVEYALYIRNVFTNPLAADSFLKDAEKTILRLKHIAGGLAICDDEKLSFYGYRIIRFKHHRYKMIYRIEGEDVYIDAVYHNLQDVKRHLLHN